MDGDSYAQARANMVDGQLRPNRVTNPVLLNAFQNLPRQRFVPQEMRDTAYIDEDLPLGHGRYMMEPMVLGRMLQAIDIKPTYSVLEIGTATGYGAAILGRIARRVVALESDAGLARRARAALAELELGHVSVVEGPLEAGYPQRAPYDVILFSGAVTSIPQAIIDQLGTAGFILAVIRAAGAGMGQALLLERVSGGLARRTLFDTGTPLLPGFAPVPAFSL